MLCCPRRSPTSRSNRSPVGSGDPRHPCVPHRPSDPVVGRPHLLVGAGFVVNGVMVVIDDREDDSHGASRWQRARILEGVLWIAAGLFVLLYMGLTVRLLAAVIAVGLIVSGVRTAAGARGVASAILGLLALLWPDITLLVAAVAFGARLVIGGITEGWRALRGEAALSL